MTKPVAIQGAAKITTCEERSTAPQKKLSTSAPIIVGVVFCCRGIIRVRIFLDYLIQVLQRTTDLLRIFPIQIPFLGCGLIAAEAGYEVR